MENEFLDIYNSINKHIGREKRKIVHLKGIWHKTFHCWFIYKDSKGEDYILMQKRASHKENWPSKLDITIGGHYTAGENISGGIREVKEELGIVIHEKELLPLGVRVCVEDYEKNVINREFQDVFFVIKNINLNSIKLQYEEVVALFKLRIDDCLKLFSKEIEEITISGVALEGTKDTNKLVKRTTNVSLNEFIPSIDNYMYKIMVLAKRALANEKHLLI